MTTLLTDTTLYLTKITCDLFHRPGKRSASGHYVVKSGRALSAGHTH
ncbi:hypothetical protein HMPREF1608_04066 [Escherichia coli 908525]|nr:hypothetical protein HMPREF1608_04066 [Escherichia coli 908525]